MQYVAASAIWGVFTRWKEKKGATDDTELTASEYLNWPALAFFGGKVIAVIWGYVLLLLYVKDAIKFQ